MSKSAQIHAAEKGAVAEPVDSAAAAHDLGGHALEGHDAGRPNVGSSDADGPNVGGVRTKEIMLLEFLRENDAACPVCGYNVRALTRPVCPECKQELVLTVGAARLRMGWLFAAVAPGFFSGIAAFFVLVAIIISFIVNDPAPGHIIATDLFGWCSGAVAMLIIIRRIRFLAQPARRQRLWTLAIWAAHLAAFIALFAYALTL